MNLLRELHEPLNAHSQVKIVFYDKKLNLLIYLCAFKKFVVYNLTLF